jgi:hypothetical protein
MAGLGMRRTEAQTTGRAGVLFVHEIVNSCQSLFHEIHQEDDLGLDAYVEFCDKGRPSGRLIALQIKAGTSYRAPQGYKIPADRKHFHRWGSFTVPVAGIVVDLDIGKAFWVNISEYLSQNPEVANNGPYVIPVPDTREFDRDTFGTVFRKAFAFSAPADLSHAADLFLSARLSERWQGFLGLVAGESRYARLVPLLLASGCTDENTEIRANAGVALSRYFGHPEFSFDPPHTLRLWAERVVARIFDRRTVRLLLEAIDENGFERGSFGQSFAILLDAVPGIGDVLLSIGLDVQEDYDIRHSAILLMGYLGYTHMLPALIRSVEVLASTGLGEVIEWVIEELASVEDDVLPPDWRTELDERLAVDPTLQPALPLIDERSSSP